MESPRSPGPPSPRSRSHSTPSNNPPTPIPLDSPLRTYPKRNLPAILSSTSPHGHLSGHPRTPSQQSAFDTRKAEILNTMSAEQIEKRYIEVSEKVREVLEERERQEKDVEEKMENLRMQREREMRVWEKLRGKKEGG
ncbi:MAG: hypothetical protein L6R41_002310 [Letrouitia leprolyta]|nr:MAG: hypothetical protein L6R41_002310 [Letrouitia leprolyta]